MRGRRHHPFLALGFAMTAGCADMVGIGPLDVAEPPESATSPTSPTEEPAQREPPSRAPRRTGIAQTVDPTPTCTERETPLAAPRVVFNGGGGSAWTMTNAIMSEDDVSARAIPDLTTNDTQVLVAVGFGFEIPENAIIHGVTVELRVRQGFGPANVTRDKLVGLVPFERAANLKLDTPYTGTFTTRRYAGEPSHWGATLTPKIVNAPEFGVVFQSARTVYPAGTSVEVDVLRMKVAYCA